MFTLSKRKSFALKAGISIAFVLWLIYKVKWADVWETVRHVEARYLALYIALVLIGMLFSAKKWKIIARYKGFQRTTFGCFRAYLTGTFINNFFPGFIGGDMYRTHWLGKQREGYTLAISTIVFDRLSGLFAAALLATAFSFMRFETVIMSSVWTLCLVLLTISVVGALFWGIIWRNVSDFILVQHIVRVLPRKVQIFLSEVRDYFHKDILIPTITLSLLFNIFGIGLANLILFKAFGQSIPVIDFFAVIFLISIISSIPISVNNIGVKEWAYFTFFALISVNPEVAITVAIVSRFIQMLLSFLAFPDFLKRKQLGLEEENSFAK
ncbi:MAG: lysylphosphatidylglycerol synthase transmembrane domain-containing protein [Candidatus Moranbacteria bacterium]|nr:lysylphosphatidylglycerol synthase transmembrane domain-containing protein [Candidatus Moranbacteria bacterium]